jgi:hypothetical protein
VDTAEVPSAATNACALGLACNPIPIDTFPTTDARSTTEAPGALVDSWGCAPDIDESGPEFFYAITTDRRGILSIRVDDTNGDEVDIDVHLLANTQPASCLNRDNIATSWVVDAGTTIAVADTYVNQQGAVLAGNYLLHVDFLPLDSGPCAVIPTDVRMFWDECGPGMDCDLAEHTDGESYPFVHTPSVGPVVKEAHLVATGEVFDAGWPMAIDEEIAGHYAQSEAASGHVMSRTEPWAPDGEGGSAFGQGATGVTVPPEAETWYVNMYWRDRPAPGHRMLLFNPISGAAVVAAGGYETGPGSNTALGGATEEVHDVLGTVHRDDIVMAYAMDQTLSYGPIVCW